MLLSATAHSIPLNHIIQRKVTKRELYSHEHYVAGYVYFRLAILRTIQFCIIYVNLYCVVGMQLGAPILCIVPQIQFPARYITLDSDTKRH